MNECRSFFPVGKLRASLRRETCGLGGLALRLRYTALSAIFCMFEFHLSREFDQGIEGVHEIIIEQIFYMSSKSFFALKPHVQATLYDPRQRWERCPQSTQFTHKFFIRLSF